MTPIITSRSHPHVVAARKLASKKHRAKQGRFGAEGLQILGMALDGMETPFMRERIHPIELFYCDDLLVSKAARRLKARFLERNVPATPVSASVLDSISDRVRSQGLYALFSRESFMSAPPTANVSEETQLHVAIDRPQYPGNVGTLIRTADAVGAACVLLIEPSADPTDPKAIRASMGSIFSVPILMLPSASALAKYGRERRLQWVGANPRASASLWASSALEGTIGLLLGNEGEGLQPELEDLVHERIHIPQHGCAESLNVSIAGGILMYEWLRVNSGSPE